jgi:hypothetical protein
VAAARSVLGDGRVPVASALGDDADPERSLALPPAHRFVAYGTSHLDLLSRSDVCDQIRSWLAGPASPPATTARTPDPVAPPSGGGAVSPRAG